MRYFRASDIFGAVVYFKGRRAPGHFSLPNEFQKSRNPSRWLARKNFSGTRLVRKSAQGLFSPWNKLPRQKCRSPENIASSRLVAPGSPRMDHPSHLPNPPLPVTIQDFRIQNLVNRASCPKMTPALQAIWTMKAARLNQKSSQMASMNPHVGCLIFLV